MILSCKTLQTAVPRWGMCHLLGIPKVYLSTYKTIQDPQQTPPQPQVQQQSAKTPNRNIADCSKAGTMPNKASMTAGVPPFES